MLMMRQEEERSAVHCRIYKSYDSEWILAAAQNANFSLDITMHKKLPICV